MKSADVPSPYKRRGSHISKNNSAGPTAKKKIAVRARRRFIGGLSAPDECSESVNGSASIVLFHMSRELRHSLLTVERFSLQTLDRINTDAMIGVVIDHRRPTAETVHKFARAGGS